MKTTAERRRPTAVARGRAQREARGFRAGVSVLALALGLAGCRIAGPAAEFPPRVGVPGLPAEEPTVRVGLLVDTPRVELSAPGGFQIADDGGAVVARGEAGDRWRFEIGHTGLLVGHGPGGRMAGPAHALVLRPTSGPVLVGEQPYRGSVLVRPAADGAARLTVINLVELEQYLLGVVPHELGKRPPEEIEAVKAQAIAARTYAISHRGRRAALGFDYYATVQDQVYRGSAGEEEVATRAVRETRGQILTYRGQPIETYYHSTCGGRTASIEEVWRAEPRPYLRSVSDAVPGQPGRFYCDGSNRFTWSEQWSREALLRALGEGLSAHLGERVQVRSLRGLAIDGRTRSGRVQHLVVETGSRTARVRGDSTRWILRPEPGRILNSALFELAVEREGDEIVAARASGGGWGHGIGMCQVGAMGRARAGHDHREILTAYYTGAAIARLY